MRLASWSSSGVSKIRPPRKITVMPTVGTVFSVLREGQGARIQLSEGRLEIETRCGQRFELEAPVAARLSLGLDPQRLVEVRDRDATAAGIQRDERRRTGKIQAPLYFTGLERPEFEPGIRVAARFCEQMQAVLADTKTPEAAAETGLAPGTPVIYENTDLVQEVRGGDGSFRVCGVPSGHYSALVTAAGFAPTSARWCWAAP